MTVAETYHVWWYKCTTIK